MQKSDISVVIPCTRPQTLTRNLVPSLVANDELPREIVIVSNVMDTAPQNTPCSVRVIRYRSAYYNVDYHDVVLKRNIGAHCAAGASIVFLDDDVVAPSNLIASFLEKLRAHPYVLGNHRFIDFRAHTWHELLRLHPEKGESREHPPNALHGWHSCYAGCLGIRKSVFQAIGGFDMIFMGMHAGEDQELGYRLMQAYGKENNFVYEPPFAWHPVGKEIERPVITRFHTTCAHHFEPESLNLHQGRVQTIDYNGFTVYRCMDCAFMSVAPHTRELLRTKGFVRAPFQPEKVDMHEL